MPFTIDDFALVHGSSPGVSATHAQERHFNQYAEAFTRAATLDDLQSPVSLQGVLTSTGDLPDDGNSIGDAYLVNGTVWVWDGSAWTNQGSLTTGPQGEAAALRLKGTVATTGDLPASGNVVNDLWTVEADGHGYGWTMDHEWVDLGAFTGPAGPGGEDTVLRARVDPGTTGPENHAIVIEGGTPEWAPRADGRARVLLYHDFTGDTDGNPNGRPVEVGGVNWATSGTVAPVVTSGKLSSTGSGYLYTTIGDTPIAVEADVSFGGSGNGNSSCTIAISKDSGGASWPNILHMIFGPTGANLQIEKDGLGLFTFVLSASWAEIPKDGTRARVRLEIRGDRATIWGPDGSAWTTRDRRIGDTLGTAYQTVFWQAGTNGSTLGYIHTVAVYGEETSGLSARSDRSAINTFERSAGPDVAWIERGKPWQVKLGTRPSAQDPMMTFGLAAGEMRGLLLAAASIGATSISSDVPMYGITSITVGYGNQAETVTASATSGTGPWTITVSALTKNHAANEPITNVTARTVECYYSMALGRLVLPDDTIINGTLYFGTGLDMSLDRSAAGALSTGSSQAYRTGRGATGSRPSASTLGSAAVWYDTTINEPIYSDGTVWYDAGADRRAVVNKTANYTAVKATDSVITCDATSGAITITLPAAASNNRKMFTIKKTDAVNNVIVDGNASETIDGATTKTITTQWGYMTIVCNGTAWFIVAQNGTIT